MQIILHIGAHKTASTHLQLVLARRRGALSRHGTALFLPGNLRKDGLRLQNYLSLAPGEAGEAEHGAQIRAALRNDACGAGRLVLSEENVLGTLYGPALFREGGLYAKAAGRLSRLAALLPAGQVTVALSLRDPAGYLGSVYSQWLMSGRIMPFERFLGATDPASLRWSDLVARLAGALPEARFVLWRYEDYPGVAPEVLQEMLGDGAALARHGISRAHPGLSARAHAAIMAEHHILVAAGQDRACTRVKALRTAFPKGQEYPAFQPFDAPTLHRSATAYVHDQARLAALPGVHPLWS